MTFHSTTVVSVTSILAVEMGTWLTKAVIDSCLSYFIAV